MTLHSAGGRGRQPRVPLAYESPDSPPHPRDRHRATRGGYRTAPLLFVNGRQLPSALARQARPNQTLLDFLRNVCGLTGSKLGCGEGGCGACTVLVSRYCEDGGGVNIGARSSNGDGDEDDESSVGGSNDGSASINRRRPSTGRIVHATVNACLFPVLAADRCHVTTVEGVGSWRTQSAGFSSCSAGGDASNTAHCMDSNTAKKEDYLHPIQRAMVDFHGSQCGFCTPGIIMALYGIFSANHHGEIPNDSGATERRTGTTVAHLEEHLDGNLCRCTGYRPIWDAARSLCVDAENGVGDMEDGLAAACGTSCRECPARNTCQRDEEEKKEGGNKKCDEKKCGDAIVCSSTQSKVQDYQKILAAKHSDDWWTQPDEMFPKELLPPRGDATGNTEVQARHRRLAKQPLMVVDTSIHNGGTWFSPHTLEELLDLFREFSDGGNDSEKADDDQGGIKMVVGNTEVGIETKFKHAVYPNLIHPSSSIHTLYEIWCTEEQLVIGACSSLSCLQAFCHDLIPPSSLAATAGLQGRTHRRQALTAQPVHDMLRWFASTQIRNVACLGGNLATASPISDMNPLLCSLGATLVLASRPVAGGAIRRRSIPTAEFFVGYRQVEKKDMEVIERIQVPQLAARFEYCVPFKQARRREDDISIVTSGMRIKLAPSKIEKKDGGETGCWIIDDICMSFGGMAPKTTLASATMQSMIGQHFEEATFVNARSVLQREFSMPDNVPGGQPQYRLTLACSFLHKFWLQCVGKLRQDVRELSALEQVAGSEESEQFPPVPSIGNDEECGAGTNNGFVSASKPSIAGAQKYPAPKVAVGLEAKHLGYNAAEAGMSLAAAASASHKSKDSVGQPATHASGPLHCTGEAAYVDDIPAPANLLHGSLILASQCHVKLLSVSIAPALKTPGVIGAFTHEDIVKLGGDNRMGPILLDDVAFLPIGEKVGFVGQVLGIVVGVSQEIAEMGARAVAVEYEELEGKALVSIEDAIEANSFWHDKIHEMTRGENAKEILNTYCVLGDKKKKLVVVEGSIRCGGQEHFYLEPNSTLAIPSESATNLTIYASTQAPTKTQDFCARVTNTPAAKVVVRVKRMGGGFGGKETRSVFTSVAAAVAAKLTNRPCKLTLSREVDMMITGGRHAFLAKYKAGAIVDENIEGISRSVKLHALSVELYNNGGCKFDLTGPVLDRALFHVDNCYYWPNFYSVGYPCKTSQPPNTAFRGFGGPQGLFVSEHIMDHLTLACNVSGDRLRRDNMYTLQDATPFGMRFGGEFTGKWNIPSMWDRLFTELSVPDRRNDVAEFNKKNKWTKRGIGFLPTKFGIAFTAKFMNQGGALVHLYTDGTVLVTHGGTEMGQGLHTKVCQVAAQVLGIPLEDVYVNDSSTDKVANTLPSAASMSTDMYGMATLDACQQILKRLKPIRTLLPPGATLKEVAKVAFFQRVDMSAHGFYALDDDRCGYDWDIDAPDGYPANLPENSWKGHPFNYFTQGVALAEVEIDVLTGDHKILTADVLVDVGSSINPAIDIGQIEGAFIQGVGWSTMEEVVYADDEHTWIRPRAKVFTTGPGTYKIPSFNDVPERFNVSLLENADNPFAVHSSKAIGEPPFFLGCSVFFAIKDAVAAARWKEGPSKEAEYFEFRMPATSERVRMACCDIISSECIGASSEAEISSFQPKGSH